MTRGESTTLDLLVVGVGPTGLAIGAEAVRQGLDVTLIDRGSICDAIRNYPTDMEFFTTRDLLEIAGIPFAVPDAKPTRAQALAYYREVAKSFALSIHTQEEVTAVARTAVGFQVSTDGRHGRREYRARAVALATGYFGQPRRLAVAGEDLDWVHARYREPYGHYGQDVLVVGGGNSAVEAALDLYRWGARVTLAHRGAAVKPTVKYWLAPDFENRRQEGALRGLFSTRVVGFSGDGEVALEVAGEPRSERFDHVYVLIGYRPELQLAREVGVEVDPQTSVPKVDPETCESNVPGFYVAGTLQAGRDTGKIFIENSRDHGPRIVGHFRRQWRPAP